MDVALKQRLVGALVLVALGVIFIPMVLDGPAGERIERPIAIPQAPDRRFETRLLPVDQPAAEAPAATSPKTTEMPAAIEPPIRPPAEQSLPAAESRPTTVQGASPKSAPGRPVAGQPQGRYVLQVGSFGNAANAARLVQNLVEAGWSAFQEKMAVGDNTLYRVRVHGWNDKQDAGLAGQRLLESFPDLDMTVHEVDKSPAEADPLQGWMIQLGSFNSQSNALTLRDKLRAGGFAAHTLDTGSTAGGRWRVRVGPELDQGSAEKTRDQIRQKFALRGIILDYP